MAPSPDTIAPIHPKLNKIDPIGTSAIKILITLCDWPDMLMLGTVGVTLGPRQTDSINLMTPLTDTHFGSLTVLRPNRLVSL